MMIRVSNLVKHYESFERGHTFREALKSMVVRKKKTVHAVKGVSFAAEEGELIGFLGPNGAGKSTTLKMLTGVLEPTSGEVNILGYVPWKERKRYVAGIGAVFGQKSQLLWDIPPVDAFYMNKEIYNIPKAQFLDTLDEMTALLQVEEQIKKPTRQLSLGERMKCEFIMAMLHRPRVVFLDEPTIGLDVIAKEKIRGFITEMNRKGTTFLLTTHDMEDVERLARRIIVINHGEIVFDDGIQVLKQYLGAKKQIRLVTRRPWDSRWLHGLLREAEGQAPACVASVPGGTAAERMLEPAVAAAAAVAQQAGRPEAAGGRGAAGLARGPGGWRQPGDARPAEAGSTVELELDLDRISLVDFMAAVHERFGIADLCVEDMAIESIIKALYGKEAAVSP